jgi:mono/diheme cytochrome c family protein
MTAYYSLHVVFTGILFVASATISMGQEAGATNQQKKANNTPITQGIPSLGKLAYKDYCSACHGATGKGDGPVADELKTPPPDLTMMAKNNNGEFPTKHFLAVLHFGVAGHAHGTSDMPVWGPLFHGPGKDLIRIRNLEAYVESIQEK